MAIDFIKLQRIVEEFNTQIYSSLDIKYWFSLTFPDRQNWNIEIIKLMKYQITKYIFEMFNHP